MLDVKEMNSNLNITLITDVTAIKQQEKISHVVFPIPASDFLNIMSEHTITEVEILSMSGKTVLKRSLSSNTVQLPVTDLKKGEYILKVINGNKVERTKIIVK